MSLPMHYRLTIIRAAVVLAALLSAASAIAQNILKSEPPMGALKPGQSVMVDDGKCGKGQIRLVTGGDHVKAGGQKQLKRTSGCVPRPE